MLYVGLRLPGGRANVAQLQARGTLAALLSLALSGMTACSYLLDFEEPQCQVDGDCARRGLAGVCRDRLCVSSSDDARGSAVASVMSEGTAEVGAEAAEPSGAGKAQEQPSASASGVTQGSVQSAAAGSSGSEAVSADGGGAGVGAIDPVGSSEPVTANSAAGTCTGGACPECTSDADCEGMGMVGGICANSICFVPDAQCIDDAECAMLGPEYTGGRCVAARCIPNPRWRCEPPGPAQSGATKLIKVPVIDAVSRAPRPGVSVSACLILDLSCASPVEQVTTDADGFATFNLGKDFSGYLETQASGYLPAMYFIPDLAPAMGVYNDFPLLSAGVVANALAQSLGGELDSARGHMMLVAEDCFFEPLGGVKFSSPQQDDKTTQFYVQDMLPSTDLAQTTDDGQAGFLNFPPGTTSLRLEQAETGLELTTVSLVIRAGYISVAFIPPRER